MRAARASIVLVGAGADAQRDLLDRVFFALSDPLRRNILERLGQHALLVSEVAAEYEISLQAVSRHIQVLVLAGLVTQERSGRISRCSLEAGPLYSAAVWLNGYSKYWQAQFDTLKNWLERDIARARGGAARKLKSVKKRGRP